MFEKIYEFGEVGEQMARYLNLIGDECHRISKEHGFWEDDEEGNLKPRNFGEMIALMHSELTEALENHRIGGPPDNHLPEYTGWHVELADEIIRVLETARAYKIPIGEIVLAKMTYNEKRENKHGKSY